MGSLGRSGRWRASTPSGRVEEWGAARIAYDFTAPASLIGVIAVFLFLTVGFSSMGLLLASIAPTARAAQAIGLVFWFVMLMLGGAGPPREALSGTMERVSDATPLWYAVEMMHGRGSDSTPAPPGGSSPASPPSAPASRYGCSAGSSRTIWAWATAEGAGSCARR
jgi:hypothetical protein